MPSSTTSTAGFDFVEEDNESHGFNEVDEKDIPNLDDQPLYSVQLDPVEIDGMIDRLYECSDEEPTYTHQFKYQNQEYNIQVSLRELKNGRRIARIYSVDLSVMQPEEYCQHIKAAVEHAISQSTIPNNTANYTYQDMNVLGVIGTKGRWGKIFHAFGLQKQESNSTKHAVFIGKLEGETDVIVEDARTSLTSVYHNKLQSAYNDQICPYSASFLFYFLYKKFTSNETLYSEQIKSIADFFPLIYGHAQAKALAQELEAIDLTKPYPEGKSGVVDTFIRKAKTILASMITQPITEITSECSADDENTHDAVVITAAAPHSLNIYHEQFIGLLSELNLILHKKSNLAYQESSDVLINKLHTAAQNFFLNSSPINSTMFDEFRVVCTQATKEARIAFKENKPLLSQIGHILRAIIGVVLAIPIGIPALAMGQWGRYKDTFFSAPNNTVLKAVASFAEKQNNLCDEMEQDCDLTSFLGKNTTPRV